MSSDEQFVWKVVGGLSALALGALTYAGSRPSAKDKCRQDCLKLRLSDSHSIQCFQVCHRRKFDSATESEAAVKTFELAKDEEPWFGIEQEYTLFNRDGRTRLGWPANGYPAPSMNCRPYYPY